MAVDQAAVRIGMDVYARDGEKLGSVVRVWQPPEQAGIVPESASMGDAQLSADVAGNAGHALVETPGGTFGSVPLGVTTDKDRGGVTGAQAVARHGDPPTVSGADEGALPGAGGRDAMRGYGMSHGESTDVGARGSALSNTSTINATGDAADIDAALRGTDRGMTIGPSGGGGIVDALDRTPGPGYAMSAGRPPDTGASGGAGPGDENADNAAVEGSIPAGRRRVPYFTVSDPGFLGVGGRALHIPYGAVESVNAEGEITLREVSSTVRERYSGAPGLEIDEDADLTPY